MDYDSLTKKIRRKKENEEEEEEGNEDAEVEEGMINRITVSVSVNSCHIASLTQSNERN